MLNVEAATKLQSFSVTLRQWSLATIAKIFFQSPQVENVNSLKEALSRSRIDSSHI
jgi:hypothetical protein